MNKNRYDVFEAQYGSTRAKTKQAPFLYTLLKRFETHRIQKVSELVLGKNLRVLEIGCGDGTFLYKNKDKWKSVTGIDVIKNQIQKAKYRAYDVPATFVVADFGLEAMPYKSSSFDLVASISTIQYMMDLELLFTEVLRVLKPGGFFLLEVPNSAAFWRRFFFLFGQFPSSTEFTNQWDGGVIHYFTKENLTRFLVKKGFHIEAIVCSGIFDKPRSVWPGFLGGDLIIQAKKVKT